MSSSFDDAVSRLASQADAVGRLAQDDGGFAAVVAAFESRDTSAFRWVLDRLEMLPYCELICEWVRIKLCTLRCSEICTPIDNPPIPSFEAFARAVARLSENEEGLRRLVDAVACGNAEDYAEAIDDLKLREFCRPICFWICGVGYRRICEIVCRQEPVIAVDAAAEVRAAGRLVANALANERAFAAINKAAIEGNCEILREAINEARLGSGCHLLCHLICVWRCVRVCRELCTIREPIFTGPAAIEEARNFALAFRKLAAQPRALGDLVTAVQAGNADSYSAIVSRYGLVPYCRQICSWICGLSCSEFCYCVCPPPVFNPLFTSVGDFNIYADIDPATGLTNKSLPPTPSLFEGGGPNFAFFEQLQLGGWCPATSPISAGTPMQYRFLFATEKTTLAAAIGAGDTTIHVTGGAALPPAPFTVSVCNAGETGEVMTVTNVASNTWTVTRAQDGTLAEAAANGATLWINPQPIAGSLVYPWQVGSRLIMWPSITGAGKAGADILTSQTLYVYSPPFVPPPELPPPALGSNWYGPSIHYIEADPATGWVEVDQNAVGGGFAVFLAFNTTQVGAAQGGNPVAPGEAIGTPGGAPAGSPAPANVGVDMTLIFQATRVGGAGIDFTNSLCKIHVNNWEEVNNLWFNEFAVKGNNCCVPIDDTLTILFTVDHETMGAGAWSLAISSCCTSAPGLGDHTPSNPTPGVTFSAGGRGAYGSIQLDTSAWNNCSYTAKLFTRPGLTTGLADRPTAENDLTFCICQHEPCLKQ